MNTKVTLKGGDTRYPFFILKSFFVLGFLFLNYLPCFGQFEDGDTVDVISSGLDTTYIIYYEPIDDSLHENLWVVTDPLKMIVQLTHHSAEVNTGLIGINLTDIFEPNKAQEIDNTNYNDAPDPWQAIIDLAPKTVRVFSGASAKFMHPLGSLIDPATNLYYGGYGYNWKEVISYYDMTDFTKDGPVTITGDYDWTLIESQLADDCDGCETWINDDYSSRLVEFYEKSISQPTFNPSLIPAISDRPLYMNDLIRLIDRIEGENTGHTVDVLYCVNIESQSATELLEVIDYLRLRGINLVGLELGNEVMGKFGADAMGFDDFEHYWQYINQIPYTDTDEQDDLENALSDDMEDDHNYIEAIKGNSEYWDILIGLPAANTPNCGASFDFPLAPQSGSDEDTRVMLATTPVVTEEEIEDTDCDCNYPDWNIAMAAYYDEEIGPPSAERHSFDAVILHTYYTTTNNTANCEVNSNWRDIMIAIHEEYPEESTDLEDYAFTDMKIDSPTWTYTPTADTRLDQHFKGIVGVHYPLAADPLLPGNFKEFTRDRLDISFEEHAYWLDFESADVSENSKEIWITEYNLDDEVKIFDGTASEANIETFENYAASVDNTFAHAVLMQNWFLWFVKSNYDPSYRDMFLTRATVQNILGGSKTMLMTKYDRADLYALTEIGYCGDPLEVDPYFIRRATYFSSQLWRVINDNDLKYLKTFTTMATTNNNLAPTLFIDEDELNPRLFVFYSNVNNATQWFGIDPGTLIELLGDEITEYVDLGTDITATILDADQLYSTSGYAPVFDINSRYNTCPWSYAAQNRFEITQLDSYSPNVTCPGAFVTASPNGVCVELPAISMGYIEIPIEILSYRRGNPNNLYSIHPNPSSTHFYVQKIISIEENSEEIDLTIYSPVGELVLKQKIHQGEPIDISSLPVGVYSVNLRTNAGVIETEQLVKMK